MYIAGVPQNVIAKNFGVTEASISSMLRDVKASEKQLRSFADLEAMIVDKLRVGLLSSLSDMLSNIDISKANPNDVKNLMIAYATAYDKMALMRGKATEHIGIIDYSQGLDELKKLEEEIGHIDIQPSSDKTEEK